MSDKKDHDEIKAEEFMRSLLSEAAGEEPCDTCEPQDIELDYPPWYDEEKFIWGQQYYARNTFAMFTSKLAGLVAVMAIPSILKVLINTGRSSTHMTAYRRYVSTIMHDNVWEKTKLEPGSESWRSIRAVRSRHIRATRSFGMVSQRDLALTQFGFMGFMLVRPQMLGVRATARDEEGLVHFWRTIVHMIGLHDKYNLCRPTVAETKRICELCVELVFRPALGQVPEHFNHMALVLLDGLWAFVPFLDPPAFVYFTRTLAGVPGYELFESQRLALRMGEMSAQRHQYPEDVPRRSAATAGERVTLPNSEMTPISLDEIPAYRRLNAHSRWTLGLMALTFGHLLTTFLGRLYFNLQIAISMFLIKYFPFLAYWRYGFRRGQVDMFAESIAEEAALRLNSEVDLS